LAEATFKIESWDEQPYAELENGGKLTKASVTQALSGDVEGEGSVEWLMCYRDDGTADFVGLQRIVGRLGDRTGSFVVLQAGPAPSTAPPLAPSSPSCRAPGPAS